MTGALGVASTDLRDLDTMTAVPMGRAALLRARMLGVISPGEDGLLIGPVGHGDLLAILRANGEIQATVVSERKLAQARGRRRVIIVNPPNRCAENHYEHGVSSHPDAAEPNMPGH